MISYGVNHRVYEPQIWVTCCFILLSTSVGLAQVTSGLFTKPMYNQDDELFTKYDEEPVTTTMWDPQTIAKLVNITPIIITMVYGTYNYS